MEHFADHFSLFIWGSPPPLVAPVSKDTRMEMDKGRFRILRFFRQYESTLHPVPPFFFLPSPEF